ncbi:MAG TPA: hypothetical protein VHQ65_08620 [Thermoanaerobaculia bacterium]|nr:hypothetical protein [Thermoanaerobaculia bacterium]
MSGGDFRFGTPRATAQGVEMAVTVPVDSPWFAGHFPGRPILPGVAHLHLACRLAALPDRAPAALAAVEAWRWSEPVAPGDELVATLAPAGAGRGRFALRRAGEDDGGERWGLGGGTLAWAGAGDPAGDAPRRDASGEPAAEGSSAGPAFGSIAVPSGGLATLLPHQSPARLAETLQEAGPERLVCRGRIDAGHPAVSPLGAPSFLAVELAAQCCAGWPLADGEGGEDAAAPRVGYLVRLRDVRFARPWLAAAAPLTARLELEGRTGPLTLCHFRVEDAAGTEVAAGTLGVFQPPAR